MSNGNSALRQTAPASRVNVKKLVILAMLSAISFVVVLLSKLVFQPFAVAGFLTIDLKDVIITIGGFIYGPMAACAISVVVSVIEMVTISATGYIGLIMNVLSTCAFACAASAIYRRHRNIKGAVAGLVTGALLMTVVMLLWNYIITPLYMNATREQVASMLLPIFLPFNLVKAAMNSALTLILYKPIVGALRNTHFLPASSGGVKRGISPGVTLTAAAVLVTSFLLVLVLSGKL